MNDPIEPPANDSQRMSRPGGWMLAIFLAGIGLFIVRLVILYVGDPSYKMTAHNLGGATASLIWIIFVPGTVAVFWWRTRKFDATRATEPLIAYALLTALFAFTSLKSAWSEANPPQASSYAYRPNQCEFSVLFPVPPHTAQVDTESLELMNERELGTETAFLRAGCVGLERTELREKEVLMDFLADLGSQMGLQDAVMSSFVEGEAVVGSVRGKKTVNGREAMLEFRWYVGNHTAMMLTTAASVEGYPVADVIRFQESVEYLGPDNVD